MAHEPLDRLLCESPAVAINALRYLAAEIGEYATPADMRQQMGAVLGPQGLDELLHSLTRHPKTLEALGLSVVAEAPAEVIDAAATENALTAAREALPIPDVEATALVVIYALWLLTTRGRRRSIRIIRRLPDGATERVELTEWYGATEGLDQLRRLLAQPTPVEEQSTADGPGPGGGDP